MEFGRFLRRVINLAMAWAILSAPALAADAAPATTDNDGPGLKIGFDGHYKVGAWTPVWLAPGEQNGAIDSSQIIVSAPDGDGVLTHYSGFVSRPAGESKSSKLLGYARFGRLQGKVQVKWSVDEKAVTTIDPPPALISTRRLILTLADDLGVEAAVKLSRGGADSRAVVATVTDSHALPDRWFGYEGVDVVVVSTAADGVFAQLSPDQHMALETWVRLGGRLVVNLSAAESPPAALKVLLPVLLPGRWQGVRALRDAGDLERFLGRSAAVEVEPAEAAEGGLKHVQLADVQGVIDCPVGAVGREHPLIVRSAHGLGLVTVVTVDLTQPALAAWADRPRLLHALLEGGESAKEAAHEETWGEAAQLGFTEMSGQLRSALDQFPAVRMAPFSTIAALAGLYILCLGPLDYFLLRRLGLGAEFTWLSFSLLVLFAGGGALATARAWKGESVQVNQVDLVDADLATGTVRGATWAHVFSPHNETFDLQLQTPRIFEAGPTAKGPGCLLSWQGLAGTGLGGMDLARHTPPFAEPYTIAAEHSSSGSESIIHGAPIPVGGTKSFLGRWWQEGAARPEAKLTATENKLTGEIYNPLPWTVEDPMLLYNGEFYRLGEPLPPRAGRAFDSSLLVGGPRSLKYMLNRRRVLDTKETKDVSSRYDPTGFDVPRIMEISLLHKAAGGANYTGLTQRYQAFVDASDLLAVERAVIMGHVREPATQLRRAGEPLVETPATHATFVRLVLPVVTSPANPAPSP